MIFVSWTTYTAYKSELKRLHTSSSSSDSFVKTFHTTLYELYTVRVFCRIVDALFQIDRS